MPTIATILSDEVIDYRQSNSLDFLAMKVISVRVPERVLREMEDLVRAGIYTSVSQLVRTAIHQLLREERVMMIRLEAIVRASPQRTPEPTALPRREVVATAGA